MKKKKGKFLRQKTKDEAEAMRILSESSIIVQTILYPCEDYEKVVFALKNIVDSEIEERNITLDKKLLVSKGRGEEYIIKIFSQFRRRRVLAAVRKYLIRYIDKRKSEIVMFLHKQAAFNGVFSICDPGESPLGEIIIRIKVREPEKIVRWLTSF